MCAEALRIVCHLIVHEGSGVYTWYMICVSIYATHKVLDDTGNTETQVSVYSIIGSVFSSEKSLSFVCNGEIAVRSSGTVFIHT